ncbi:MAG: PAS domain-containing protein, partial [Dehalococcoidia bacterium]|nr:PAS domain-containing protein [Dehalococcoidia bacterium]
MAGSPCLFSRRAPRLVSHARASLLVLTPSSAPAGMGDDSVRVVASLASFSAVTIPDFDAVALVGAALVATLLTVWVAWQVGRAVALARDRQQAAARDTLAQALATSESNLSVTSELLEEFWRDSPSMIVHVHGPTGRIEYVSPNIARLLGEPPEAALASPRFFDERVHPDD